MGSLMTQKMIGYWDESWTQRSLQGLTSLALEDDAMRSSDIRRLICVQLGVYAILLL